MLFDKRGPATDEEIHDAGNTASPAPLVVPPRPNAVQISD